MPTLTIKNERIDRYFRIFAGRKCRYKKDRKSGEVIVSPEEGIDLRKMLSGFRSFAKSSGFIENELAQGVELNEDGSEQDSAESEKG